MSLPSYIRYEIGHARDVFDEVSKWRVKYDNQTERELDDNSVAGLASAILISSALRNMDLDTSELCTALSDLSTHFGD
jgi:hypothetical protein